MRDWFDRFVSLDPHPKHSYNQDNLKSKQRTLDELRLHRGHGGPRIGAGRPAAKRPPVHHVRRPSVPRGCPAHVTLRVRPDVPSLRNKRFVNEFRRSLARGAERGEFRVVEFSIQRDHAHLIVEAAGKPALGRGMKSVGARFARAVNRTFGRSGPVLFGRYHLHLLTTPREVRNALAYVLLNARKHFRQRRGAVPPVAIDEASSGRWFDGWKKGRASTARASDAPVATARSWLLRVGWRRHGLIDPAEVPGVRGVGR